MTPPRFRSPSPLTTTGARVDLGDAVARHAHVLRLSIGAPVVVFDGTGREASAEIRALTSSSILVELGTIEERAFDTHAPVLVQCVPKGSKLDDIVRAATEAGVGEIHLALAARSIARAEGARFPRLGRIAEEAARQSEAPSVPNIVPPARLLEVAARAPSTSARIVLSPRASARMRGLLGADRTTPPWLVVGPEGGLDDDETSALMALGYTLGRLDTYVLRTEHAGPIAVAIARELSA